jgi:hypothetical protein
MVSGGRETMNKVRCAHCHYSFIPNHRIKNQRYCRKKECQRARKSAWQRRKLDTDPDYKANQRECQKSWSARNPDYWQSWRALHPEYGTRNRNLQKARRSRRRRRIAKMDASAQKVFLISSG